MKTSIITCLGKPVTLYESGGANEPTVLMIHGNSAPTHFLAPLIRLLEATYHIITLDLPGHNQSVAWEKEEYTRENLALLLNSVLEHFKIKKVNAFGFSMGGLILLECFDLIPAIQKIAIAGHPPLHSVNDMPEAYNLNEDVSLYLQGPLTDEEIERIYNAVIAIDNYQLKIEISDGLRETSPSFREGCTLLAQSVDGQVTKLNTSSIHIAIIHAEDDMAIRYDYLKKLQIKNLWKQNIQLIAGSGHFLILEKPEELSSMLDQFFSEV